MTPQPRQCFICSTVLTRGAAVKLIFGNSCRGLVVGLVFLMTLTGDVQSEELLIVYSDRVPYYGMGADGTPTGLVNGPVHKAIEFP